LKNVFIKLCQKIKKTEDSNYFVFWNDVTSWCAREQDQDEVLKDRDVS
jgi:hypothetical protein